MSDKKDNEQNGAEIVDDKLVHKKRIKKQSSDIYNTQNKIRIFKLALLIMLFILILTYLILRIVYDTGRFTVTLDTMSDMTAALIMYEKEGIKTSRRVLKADALDFITNIDGDWIPEDIDSSSTGGPNNGDNFIGYTFYVENIGDEVIHYWSEIIIDDVIKNVDEAIRVAIYHNGEKTVYAKASARTGEAEKETIPFKDEERVFLNKRELFAPGDIDKFTIIIWIEGNDPECIDNLIGGEMKMHMNITEEHINQDFLDKN